MFKFVLTYDTVYIYKIKNVTDKNSLLFLRSLLKCGSYNPAYFEVLL